MLKTCLPLPSTALPRPTASEKPVLRLGVAHKSVAELQRLLSGYVNHVPSHGIFDIATDYAVRVFQYQMFLREDGIVDAMTWLALYAGFPVSKPGLKLGSWGVAVQQVQTVLLAFGMTQRWPDGHFGEETGQAVQVFQARMGLTVDGQVGPQTWRALSQVRLEDPTHDLQQIQLVRRRAGHYREITRIAVSPPLSDPKAPTFATASQDALIRFWRLAGNPINLAYGDEGAAVNDAVFTPEGQWLISGGVDGTVRLTDWALQTDAAFSTQGGAIKALAVDPAGRYLLTASENNAVNLLRFDGTLIKELHPAMSGNPGTVLSVAVSPREDLLAIANHQTGVTLWRNPLHPYSAQPFYLSVQSAHLVRFSPNGLRLAVADQTVLRMFGTHGQQLSVGEYPQILDLAFSASGRYLAIACQDGTIHILDLPANHGYGKVVHKITAHSAPVTAIAFSKPEQFLYSGDASGNLAVWSLSFATQ